MAEIEETKGAEETVAGTEETTPTPVTLPTEGMPDELKGMPVEQFNSTWEMMRQAMGAQQYAQEADKRQEEQRLQTEQQAPPPPPVEYTEEEKATLKERMLDDPYGTVKEINEKIYGPLINQLSTQSHEGIYASFRTQASDFAEHEPKVREIINGWGLPAAQVQQNHIASAYYMAKGLATEKADNAAAKAKEAEDPKFQTETSTPVPEVGTPAALSEIEAEIAKNLGMVDKDGKADHAAYRQWGGRKFQESEVPTEAKGYGKSS